MPIKISKQKWLFKRFLSMTQMEKEGSGSLASMVILASDWLCTDNRSLCLLRALGYSSKRTKDIRHIKEEILVSLNEPFLKWNFIRYGFDGDDILKERDFFQLLERDYFCIRFVLILYSCSLH